MKNTNKILYRFLVAFVALVILAAGFSAGYFTRKFTQGPELTSLEWVLKTINENYYGDVDTGDLVNKSLAEIAAGLDPYSEYYTKEEFEAEIRENSGERSGIGISYNFVEGVGVRIITVVGNSPAWHAGLRAGDEITGGSAGGVEAEFTTSITVNGVKKDPFPIFMNARETGEEFTLNVKDWTEPLKISKQVYTSSYTFMATNSSSWEFETSADKSGLSLRETNESISCLPNGAAYINLSQFFGTAGEEFGVLLEKFNDKNCTSLILDLRNNGGGYVSVMQDIAGYFTGDTSVAMTAKYKNGREEVYRCTKHDKLVDEDTTVYVLANSGTASASEALIGVLISYDFLKYENIFISDYTDECLKFLGDDAKTAQTYGKGIMQTTFMNYFTGEALKLTTAKIFWPDEKETCIHAVGLNEKSGCTIVHGVEWSATKNDEELQKVCELILAK